MEKNVFCLQGKMRSDCAAVNRVKRSPICSRDRRKNIAIHRSREERDKWLIEAECCMVFMTAPLPGGLGICASTRGLKLDTSSQGREDIVT